MVDADRGEAVIVYDDPSEGTVEHTVSNKRIAYFQDHWIVKFDEDDAGNDIVRRIPVERVYYVERSVEQFEEEVKTLRNQVESFAEGVRSTVFGSRDTEEDAEPHRIDVESETDESS